MSNTFDETRLQIINEINQQTVQTLNTLTCLWKETFEAGNCIANAEKLSEHVKTFYNEIIDETKTRQQKFKLEIKQMYAEAVHLKKMLKVGIKLEPEDDVPMYSLHSHLTECLQVLREQLEHRQGKIDILLEEQKALCLDLDETPKELKNGSTLPTDDDLVEFRQYLDDLIEMKRNRLNEFNKLRIDIEILLMKLDVSLVNMGDDTMLNDPALPLTKKNISKLYILRTNLQNRYNDMREEIEKIKNELEKLWQVFELNDDVKRRFDDIEYNQENYNKMSRELEYWEQERRSNIRQFVSKAREEITLWWTKCLFSEAEKASYSIFSSTCFTEELLSAHETQLKYLKEFYEQNEKLFSLIEERQQLWHRMQALDIQAREPGRYTNRGGQLLKEEKERKMISKKLPAIENDILALANEYQKSSNKQFAVFGTPIAEVIEQDWVKLNEYKEEIKFARKKPTETTPCKPPKLKRQVSTVKKVMKSVSNIPSSSGNTENNRFNLPKHLLKQLPARKNVVTNTPVKKSYATSHRRSSIRKSKERRISLGRITKTHVQINNSAGTDSVNYDSFKDYITPRSPYRSSMVSPKDNQTERISPKRVLLTPIPGTPISTKKLHINKSPSSIRNCTPRSSPSVRKFSTANLPILI